jgi:hypothetical protein
MDDPGNQLQMRCTRQIRPHHTASNRRTDAALQSKDHASNGRLIQATQVNPRVEPVTT